MIVVLGFALFFANYGSAGLTDTKTSITVTKGDNLTIGTKEVAYNTIWETYKPIEVKSVTNEVLFKGAIVEHTFYCSGKSCESQVQMYQDKEGILIEDFYVLDENGDRVQMDTTLEIAYDYKDVTYPKYENVCAILEKLKNGTEIKECNIIQVGTTNVKEPIFVKYNLNQIDNSGNFLIKITGDMGNNGFGKIKQRDWVIVSKGKTLNEWATWTVDLNSNLRVYATFNDTSGNPKESTGNYTLIAQNITAYGGAGKLSTALNFTATSNVNGTAVYNMSNIGITAYPFTFNAWIKGGGQTQRAEATIISLSDPLENNAKYKLGLSGNNAYIIIRNLAGTIATITGGAVNNQSWVMMTAVFTNSSHRSLYVNGVNVGNETTTITLTGADLLGIGTEMSSGAPNVWGFTGQIDEPSIWSSALSVAQIQQLYNDGTGITYLDSFTVTYDCAFNGSVKTNTGVAVNGARVVITNVNTDTVFGNVTADANGLWNKNVTADGNYSVYAYIPNNKTGGGDIKTYVECIRLTY